MNKRINIGDKEKAIDDIRQFGQKSYQAVDIEFFNVHLKELNDVCGKKIFDKNNLYVRSSTLWELMQPEGKAGKHHFHGIDAEVIYESIKGILEPYCIYDSYDSRFVIATLCKNQRDENYILVIEKHASLSNDRDANINKLITLYPKKNIENIISNLTTDKIWYLKQ